MVNKLLRSTLRKEKKLIVKTYIKKEGKKRNLKRIRVFYKKTNKGLHLNNYFFRNEHLASLRSNKIKRINKINKKIERVFTNNAKKKKIK